MSRCIRQGFSILTSSSACFSSIMRLVTSIEVIHNRDLTYRLNEEYFWTCVLSCSLLARLLITYRVAEIASGLLCGCLPVLPQFFRHFIPKIASKYRSKGRTTRTSAVSSSGKPLASNDGRDIHPSLPEGTYIELREQDNVRA